MKNFNQLTGAYLKWISPVAIIAAVLSMMGYSGNTIWYDLLGWATILWIAVLIYTVFAVAFNPTLRDSFVRKLSGIKENDERETQITGQISKKTFIFMMGTLTLLLFLSVVRIDIYKGAEPSLNGKNGAISFGMGLRFIESAPQAEASSTDAGRNYIVKYSGLPLTSDGTLVIVMLLQLGAFYFFSRKENQAA